MQATRDVDYRSRDSRLIMRENSTRAAVSVSILPDNIAEDIESFYVIIYNVTLIGQSSVGGEPGKDRNQENKLDYPSRVNMLCDHRVNLLFLSVIF